MDMGTPMSILLHIRGCQLDFRFFPAASENRRGLIQDERIERREYRKNR